MANQFDELGGVGALMVGEELVDEDGGGGCRRRRDSPGAGDECGDEEEQEAQACTRSLPS